jgi:hypothetical protein
MGPAGGELLYGLISASCCRMLRRLDDTLDFYSANQRAIFNTYIFALRGWVPLISDSYWAPRALSESID